MTNDTHTSLRLWLRLLSCTRLIENAIRADLREGFETTLPRFDVMAQLYRYPDGLRMGEISAKLMVTGGNVTGIIDQLEREGLVERTLELSDRRAWRAKLTASGIANFQAMAEVHEQWIEGLMDGLSATEQQTLHQLLKKLHHSLQDKS